METSASSKQNIDAQHAQRVLWPVLMNSQDAAGFQPTLPSCTLPSFLVPAASTSWNHPADDSVMNPQRWAGPACLVMGGGRYTETMTLLRSIVLAVPRSPSPRLCCAFATQFLLQMSVAKVLRDDRDHSQPRHQYTGPPLQSQLEDPGGGGSGGGSGGGMVAWRRCTETHVKITTRISFAVLIQQMYDVTSSWHRRSTGVVGRSGPK